MSYRYCIFEVGLAAAGILAAAVVLSPAARGQPADKGGLSIRYPLDGTLFPPEIPAPTFRWDDTKSGSDIWVIDVRFEDRQSSLTVRVPKPEWTPSDEQWEAIKRRSSEKDAKVRILGANHAELSKILSSTETTFRTSKDEVGAPLFYREVNLPFVDAVKDPSLIRWRFGPVSSKSAPPIVLQGLPVCGNCHSFTADGRTLGMDVDYANDKGSYVITRVEEEMILAKSKVITWTDYRKEDKEPTYGLLSQISPDGNYAVSTVKDRSVFVPKPDLAFSQLFFPLKGILAVYDRKTGAFSALPGADDRNFVQSNPSWSPDGKFIVFARSKAYQLRNVGDKVLLTPEECREFLKDGKTFLFDLYRVPFNEGKGGEAKPLEGASNDGMSNYFAKYSPDGKWLVFCKAKSFMLLQPDSALYIVPAEGGAARRMRCNTALMNSWHSWSPNGKWLVFSSKANGPYTQLYLTHVDAEGNDTPAVLLDRLTAPDRAANIPEFVNVKPGAIARIREQFVDDVSFVRAAHEFSEAKDYVRAAQSLRKALEINPENATAHEQLGLALAQQGQLAEAAAQFAEAVRLTPEDAGARVSFGLTLERQGKHAEAITQYTEAVRLKPDDPAARTDLGGALLKQGKLAEAAAQFAEAVRLAPDDAAPHNNLGLALARQGKLAEAAARFAEAVRLKPDFADAHDNLGLALAKQGKFEEAVAQLSESIRLDPGYAKAHENLGFAFAGQGKLVEAVAEFTEAVRLNPDSAVAHNDLGGALLGQGKVAEAAAQFTEAVRLNPRYAEAHNNLAIALEKQGNLDAAIAQFKQASEINPDWPTPRLNLQKALQEKKLLQSQER